MTLSDSTTVQFIHQTSEGPLHDGQKPYPAGWYWADDFDTRPCSGPWPSEAAAIKAAESRVWDLTGYNGAATSDIFTPAVGVQFVYGGVMTLKAVAYDGGSLICHGRNGWDDNHVYQFTVKDRADLSQFRVLESA